MPPKTVPLLTGDQISQFKRVRSPPNGLPELNATVAER